MRIGMDLGIDESWLKGLKKVKRGWKGRLAGDGFSYGELERGKWGRGQDGPLYASLAVKIYGQKTSYLGCEESFIPCQNPVLALRWWTEWKYILVRLWQRASCSVKMMSQCLKYTISPLQSINLQKIMLWQIRSHPGPQRSDLTTKCLQVGMHSSKESRVPNQRLEPLKDGSFRHSRLTETKTREHSLPRCRIKNSFISNYPKKKKKKWK